ncbi:putative bifunctional diguanylate cyclase/phosphodiesterase [Marinomonas spartinae]|uniref:putative bifunctional diguanylate cyclase/phosphodiesterase n=1 Tax=Marinomonas spartinae TaxID=1792290 RepID=UPI001F2FA607|nr:EAL domain-containing protein [Marinomonas spartinae]
MSQTANKMNNTLCIALWVVDTDRASIAWSNCHAKTLLGQNTSSAHFEGNSSFDDDFLATLRLMVGAYDIGEQVTFDWPTPMGKYAAIECVSTIISLGGERRGLSVQALFSNGSPLDAEIGLIKQLGSLSVAMLNYDGRFLEVSDVFSSRFGSVSSMRDLFVTNSNASAFMSKLSFGEPFTQEIRLSTLNGVRWHQLEVVFHPEGKVLLMANDIQQERGRENEIFRLHHFDVLTGLPNRYHLYQTLENILESGSQRFEHWGILYLDLDNFKIVNDTFDHRVGDELIQQVALRIQGVIPNNAELYRLGGDEFVIFLTNISGVESLQQVANLITRNALNTYFIANMEMMVTASIGIACYPEHGDNVDHLLKNADAAMYRAKSIGHNTSFVFDVDMIDTIRAHLTLGGGLRKAIEEEEFELFYQPKVRLSDEVTVGAEALIRWFHPELGLISPDQFIPMAEESGMILPLGEWVIRTACKQIKTWQDQGIPPISVSVNLSGRQFMQTDLVEMVAQVLEETGVDSQYLELELTESMLMADAQQTIEKLHAFRKLGVTLSIDDFGTGYSSLAYLKKFPIQTLKIDRSFVNDLGVSGGDDAIVKATIAMAKSLNLKVIAEGVENRSQIDVLNGFQCQEVQGYLFAKPMSTKDFVHYMKTQKMIGSSDALDSVTSAV